MSNASDYLDGVKSGTWSWSDYVKDQWGQSKLI